MNEGQQKFFDFIMLRVKDGNQDKAKELLDESFSKQANGTFNTEYMARFIPDMIKLIKPEFVEEVKDIMTKHRA